MLPAATCLDLIVFPLSRIVPEDNNPVEGGGDGPAAASDAPAETAPTNEPAAEAGGTTAAAAAPPPATQVGKHQTFGFFRWRK